MPPPSIEMSNVTVRFPLSFDQIITAREHVATAVRRALTLGRQRKIIRQFDALRGITLSLGEGDLVGVIGPNGGGKTTLLRTVAGIYYPDEGQLTTNGKISTLLSLGTGFNNNLTGTENIRIAGYLMGLTESEVSSLAPGIIEYAELAEFIDVPLKYYSNGMISRLGFSIVMALQPDILLIDEIFAVGDLAFRRKSEQTIENLLQRTKCQLIVTHNLTFVREHCNRALYISGGQLVMDDEPNAVVDCYEREASQPRRDSRLA